MATVQRVAAVTAPLAGSYSCSKIKHSILRWSSHVDVMKVHVDMCMTCASLTPDNASNGNAPKLDSFSR